MISKRAPWELLMTLSLNGSKFSIITVSKSKDFANLIIVPTFPGSCKLFSAITLLSLVFFNKVLSQRAITLCGVIVSLKYSIIWWETL
ncbi:hypothetical protein NW739_04425 [Mycoplasmopsis felis]|uniref:hypothetical protein n=1 Tax=Mycoplasmopsis felis TaxID=33923 RepID=UPI0021E05302|nr:hypothetical protein [Mycoplasmopsis felis]MCU9934362.1 hypothetical protein [Mycoplasmopsis felis]MCU9939948.1 hypothetical protein [Mycoplasmopsis felis]